MTNETKPTAQDSLRPITAASLHLRDLLMEEDQELATKVDDVLPSVLDLYNAVAMLSLVRGDLLGENEWPRLFTAVRSLVAKHFGEPQVDAPMQSVVAALAASPMTEDYERSILCIGKAGWKMQVCAKRD